MEIGEIFGVLGIEETKDESRIKAVYREKLAVTNPEDNPEGFKRLRKAYEEACAYARNEETEDGKEQEDTTPSGLWVKKAEALYFNIRSRQALQGWKALFEEEIFLSLEGEEECREKLLVFMMNHFKLPTDIWKLLDDRLFLIRDQNKLAEKFPRDFLNYIVNRIERGEEVEFAQFAGEDAAEYDLFLGIYDKCWRALEEGDTALAEQLLQEADGMHITHPVMEINRANLYWRQERKEDAVRCMEAVKEKFPGDALITYNMAQMLWRMGEKDRAAEYFKELKEENDTHYMSNYNLAEWYYDKQEYLTAKSCAVKVLESGCDDSFMELLRKINAEVETELLKQIGEEGSYADIMELCWCYLQDGKYSQGIKRAEALEGKVGEDRQAEYAGLLAKLYMEAAMFEKALEKADDWREKLRIKLAKEDNKAREDKPGEEEKTKENDRRKDQERIRNSYLIKAKSYRFMGYAKKEYFKEAVSQLQMLTQEEQKDPGVLMEMAQIYMEMGEHEKCLEITALLTEVRGIFAAHAIAMESYSRKLEAGGVVKEGRACIRSFPQYARAYEQVAKVFLDLEHEEELREILKEAKDNGVQSVLLNAYEYLSATLIPENFSLKEKLVEFNTIYKEPLSNNGNMENFEKGLSTITKYLHMYPGNYMLIERGLYLMEANKMEEAMADFQKALENDPSDQFALNNAGCIFKYRGEYEKALCCFRKAIRYMDEEPNRFPYGNMGDTYDKMGEYALAKEAYLALEERFGKDNDSNTNDIIRCMARCGEISRAVELTEQYYGKKKLICAERKYDIYVEASDVHRQEELLKEWKWSLLRAVRGKASYEYARYMKRRVWHVLESGDIKAAVKAMEKLLRNRKTSAGTEELVGMYEELIFFHALAGNTNQCTKYAKSMRKLRLKREKYANDYFHQESYLSYLQFLEAFYLDGEEAAEEVLRQSADKRRCRSCESPYCGEQLTAMYLLAAKRNKREEALEKCRKIGEQIPFNKYLKAILQYS